MARYLQEPSGVAERIALKCNAPCGQVRTYDLQRSVERPVERNYVVAGGNIGLSPVEDELMKELARLVKGESKA